MELTPELLQAILQGGSDSAQLDPQIEYMKMMAEQLRSDPGELRSVGGGRLNVAPTPLGFLGKTAGNIMGGYMDHKGMGMRQQQATIRGNQNQRVLDELLRQQRTPDFNPSARQPGGDPYGFFRMGGYT